MVPFNPYEKSFGGCTDSHYVDLSCDHWQKQSLAFYWAYFFSNYTRTLCDILYVDNRIPLLN